MTSAFSFFATLKERISARTARVTTIGLGYVGLPLALTISETGFPVTGFDLNVDRVAAINAGARVISYFAPDRIAQALASGRFSATADAVRLAEADIVLICVPTPLGRDRDPDLSYVIRAGETLAAHLRPGQLIVLESTVWPGATAQVLRPILERGGLRAGVDFFLGFSPEREDPGNASFGTRDIPKIVGADDKHSRDLLAQFYGSVVARAVPVGSSAAAEAVKLVENSFRTVNIALVNEMRDALAAMEVDVWEVIAAAATKPFGYMPFYPGPGIGGDCIPVSPVYLSWRARDAGAETPLIDLARQTNDSAPDRLAGRVAVELARDGVAMNGARVLILGVSYKKDIEDTRESPALHALQRIEQMGAQCDYHDPYFPVMPLTRDHPGLAGRLSVALTAATLADYDAVVLTTDHTAVDYALVAERARLVLDCRNALSGRGLRPRSGRMVKV